MELVGRGPRRDEVWMVNLNPTQGTEIRKTRPCLIVSPDEMNRYLQTLIVAPMTTTERPYPSLSVRFQGKSGQIALDQVRAIDRERLVRRLRAVSCATAESVSATLLEIFRRS